MNEGMDHETGAALASALAVARLRAVRIGLLHLHKTLLDAERERYVRERGPIDGPGHALKLVLNDPFFAWLRPVSSLVVQIDERLADNAPLGQTEAGALMDQARSLLQGDGGSTSFHERYQHALQTLPEVVVAHGQVAGLLNDKS